MTQGQTVTFSVVAAGAQPLAYFWGVRCSTNDFLFAGCGCLPPNVPTLPTLTLTNITEQCPGQYFVVVSNASGMVTSQVATLDAPIEVDFRLRQNFSQVEAERRFLALGGETQESVEYFRRISGRIPRLGSGMVKISLTRCSNEGKM